MATNALMITNKFKIRDEAGFLFVCIISAFVAFILNYSCLFRTFIANAVNTNMVPIMVNIPIVSPVSQLE